MLARRRVRRAIIKTTLGQCLVFAGILTMLTQLCNITACLYTKPFSNPNPSHQIMKGLQRLSYIYNLDGSVEYTSFSKYTCELISDRLCLFTNQLMVSRDTGYKGSRPRFHKYHSISQFWLITSKQPQDIDPMLSKCWFTVYDAGPTFTQHCVDTRLGLRPVFHVKCGTSCIGHTYNLPCMQIILVHF